MSFSGQLLEIGMWGIYLCLAAIVCYRPPGWWYVRWMLAAVVITIAFFLAGHSAFAIFGVQPWHGLMEPFVLWAESLPDWGLGMMPRSEGALILLMVGSFLAASAAIPQGQGRVVQEVGPECPFIHRKEGSDGGNGD